LLADAGHRGQISGLLDFRRRRAIQREPIELVPVFTRYVMILAAILAIAGGIGFLE